MKNNKETHLEDVKNKALKGSFQYEFYPNQEQKELLTKTFGSTRFIYNHNLSIVQAQYENYLKAKELYENGLVVTPPSRPSITNFTLINNVSAIKKNPEYAWLYEVSSTALQETAVDLCSAFSRFFKRITNKPKFKSKHGKQSFRLTTNAFKIDIEKGIFTMSKSKKPIKLCYSRKMPCDPTRVTITKLPCGKYIATFLCDVALTKTSGICKTGIDLGIKDFAVLSDGTRIANEKHYIKSQKKLRRAQQSLSRKQKGSSNRNKARIKVAKLHYHVTQQRKDFQHKLSRKLINENQVICLESLRPANMIKNRKLSKHVRDAGWGSFKNMLVHKARMSQHCNLVFVDPFYPSTHICNMTGLKLDYKLKLSDRAWKCPHCNETHDRDLNAARNIRDEGLYRLAMHDPKGRLKGVCVITSNE